LGKFNEIVLFNKIIPLMKYFQVIILFQLFVSAYSQSGKNDFILIKNETNQARTEEIISIPWDRFLQKYPRVDTAQLTFSDNQNGKELMYQLETMGKKTIQNVLILVSVPGGKTIKVAVNNKRPMYHSSKTFARYVPERKDDFAWENDRIAFRMYGKALEGTNEDAYGLDVWTKKTDQLIVNKWYKNGDYHTDHGDGLDYYKVGNSLGAGNAAPFLNDSIWFSGNYRGWGILDNGPLRTSFWLKYDEWLVAGKKMSAIKTFTLDAGTQLNKITVVYESNEISEFPVAVGIVDRTDPGKKLLDQKNAVMGYWEPIHGEDGITGVGVIFPGAITSMSNSKGHLLAVVPVKTGVPFTYFSGAAWNKAGLITTNEQWFSYLRDFKLKMKQSLKIVL
jgi:hypothetical protein